MRGVVAQLNHGWEQKSGEKLSRHGDHLKMEPMGFSFRLLVDMRERTNFNVHSEFGSEQMDG